jgi:thiol-disulfide isomerase/thioredoxin
MQLFLHFIKSFTVMRSLVLFIAILILGSPSLAQKPGMEFFQGSFEEALEEAKKSDKLIFVDAYTTWCGPCKRLKKNVFPDPKVGAFYNDHFINFAIDMETQAGKKFGMKYPVSAYPTLIFINPSGSIVLKNVGGKDIERFLALGESAIQADDRSELYGEMYTKGRRDFEFMVKYIKALNRAKKPSSKVAYDYLNANSELNAEQKAIFIFEATSSCDSKLYKMMISKGNKNLILKSYSTEAFDNKVYEVCWATVEKAILFNVTDLFDEAKKKYQSGAINKSKEFEIDVDLSEARINNNASTYLKAAKKKLKYLDTDELKQEFLIEMVELFPSSTRNLQFALENSEDLLKETNSISNMYAYAKLLIADKKYTEAIVLLDSALDTANKSKEYLKAKDIHQLKKVAENLR